MSCVRIDGSEFTVCDQHHVIQGVVFTSKDRDSQLAMTVVHFVHSLLKQQTCQATGVTAKVRIQAVHELARTFRHSSAAYWPAVTAITRNVCEL